MQLLLSLDRECPEIAVNLAAAMASEGCDNARRWLKRSGRKSGHRALDRLQDSTSWRCLDAVPIVASIATAHQLDRTGKLG